jgi:hypothetical protein
MKKSPITILIIVILAGGGYFAYTKRMIDFDFLKKSSAVVEPVATDNQQESKDISSEPIHPLCFGSNFEIYESINLEKCNKENEKEPIEKDEGGFVDSRYLLDDEYGYKGYMGYKIIKEISNIMIVQTEDNMNGSSTVTSLTIFEKNGNILNKKYEIHSGDRAHGGIGRNWTKFRDNGVDYWPHLTNMDLMEITYPGVREKFNAGSDCNMCDFAVAHYYYNLATQKSTLISVLIDSHFLDESPEEEESCTNAIYKSYIPDGKTQTEITPKQVDELNKKLMDTCIE